MVGWGSFMRWRGLLAVAVFLAAGGVRAEEAPLQAGVAQSAPPFVMEDGHGALSGFTIELFRAIAARMKRGIVFMAVPQADLAKGLEDRRFDLLPGPIPATPERAADTLFTEGYIWSEYQFGGKPGHAVDVLDALRGLRLAVHTDSDHAEWADRNARKYGFSVLDMPNLAAVFDAVKAGRADASLTDSAALRFAASRGQGLVAGMTLPETRTHDSAAFRPGDVELRDEVEDNLRCLKQDGTVARISKTWFGVEPGPEDLERLVVPGNGVPGLSGYDQKTRKTHC
jgi:polar amino acid transport system substrate-binding protein